MTAPAHSKFQRLLPLAALSALCLLLLRVLVIAYLEAQVRGAALDFTLWRLGLHIAPLAIHSALAGLLVALCAILARGGAGRLALLPGALAAYTALSGWPWAEAHQIPGWSSSLGRMGIASLALASVLLMALVTLRTRRPLQGDLLAHRMSAALALLAYGGFIALMSLLVGKSAAPGPQRSQPVSRVLHELAFEEDLWTTIDCREGGEPRAYMVTPSMDYRFDGGDMPALVMPPPSTVRFTVPDDGGEVWLTARTGVDKTAPRSLPKRQPRIEVELSVLIDGVQTWSAVHVIDKDAEDPGGLLWQDLPETRLVAGQEVELRSRIIAPEDPEKLPLLALGFGSLALERREEKPLSAATASSPNIVLIVMDTLRQDRLSCYGYGIETTPALDRLAERGILYENAYSTASWTWPSTASILTGLHPETHGVLADAQCYLNNTVETLPEVLSQRNFLTAAFTCNPLIVPNKNFDQGFDHFDSFHQFRDSARVIGGVQDWIRQNAASRFFLYIQFTDPHEKYHLVPGALERAGGVRPEGYHEQGLNAYHGPLLRGAGHDAEGNSTVEELIPEANQEFMQRAYDAAVITADTYVGLVLDELAANGLEGRTIVAFTSDHGEELLDHGMVTHGHTLFPELTRVPLILAGPGLASGERVQTPVSNRHLAPSLAAIGNATFKLEQDPIDLKAPELVREQPIYFSTKQGWWNGKKRLDLYGVRDGGWELHWAPKGADWGAPSAPDDGQFRLYDLSNDPEAKLDVAAQHPERAGALLEQLRDHVGRAIEGRPKLTVGAGARSREALIGIGYIQLDPEEEGDSQ
jgi:arylsulfatase A-like enzyme